jgi:hypothetical protein
MRAGFRIASYRSMAMEAAVTVRGLAKRYDEVEAVRGIDLD